MDLKTDPLTLTKPQQEIIDKTLEGLGKFQAMADLCRIHKLHQIQAWFQRSTTDLETVIQSQLNEFRANGLPENWSGEEKENFLKGIEIAATADAIVRRNRKLF